MRREGKHGWKGDSKDWTFLIGSIIALTSFLYLLYSVVNLNNH